MGQDTGTPHDHSNEVQGGQHLNPKSVDADAIDTVADHIIRTTDDPQSVFANDVVAGDTVVFETGTHTVPLTSVSDGHGIQISQDNVEFVIPSGAVLKLADNELTSDSDTAQLIQIADGVTNPTIRGNGAIDGNVSTNTQSGTDEFHLLEWGDNVTEVTIENLLFQNTTGNIIRMQAADSSETTDISIRGIRTNNVAEGIVGEDAEDVRITDFHIENVTDQDAIEPANGCVNWTIADGTIRDMHADNHCFDIFDTTEDITIDNVKMYPGTGGSGGISTSGGSSVSTNLKVTNCILYNCGISANAPEGTISGNTIKGGGIAGNGISVGGGNVTIEGNTVEECDFRGIVAAGPKTVVANNTVRNNDVGGDNATAGIRLDDTRQTCVGNNVYDDQATATQQHGILVSSSATEAFVQGNHCWGNESNQIDTTNAPASAVIQNNKTG